MKKILIFYSKTGGGHLRAAEAIAEEIKKIDQNIQVVLHDGLAKTNLGLDADPAKGFLILSNQLLALNNAGHQVTNNQLGTKALRSIIKTIWQKNFQSIIKTENPDFIVSTHPFISPSTYLPSGKGVPYMMVATDLMYPHRVWFDEKANKIITPTPQMAEHAKRLLKKDVGKVLMLGYPLKDGVKKLKLSSKFSNTILVLGGGAGAGSIKKQIKILLKNLITHKIIVFCGINLRLKNELSKIPKPNLEVYGFVNNPEHYINQADIIITKPGPGTIMEAAVAGKPMIITKWIGLQEKDNIDFVLENKLGIYCPKAKDLPKAVEEIYGNYSNYSHPGKFKSGTEKIAKFLLSYIKA